LNNNTSGHLRDLVFETRGMPPSRGDGDCARMARIQAFDDYRNNRF